MGSAVVPVLLSLPLCMISPLSSLNGILTSFHCNGLCISDPFAEANAEDSGAGSKEYVHIRVQQRNGRKSLTTVQGLKKEYSYSKILKDLKKEFCCNGTVVQDPELGQVGCNISEESPAWFTFSRARLILSIVQLLKYFCCVGYSTSR